MKKRLLSFALALVMVLALTTPVSASAFSNGISVSDPSKHLALAYLPATLQRPAYPNTVGQTDPLLVRFTDFEAKENTWSYPQSMESVFQEIVALTDSLTAGKTTDTQKAKAIFDWVSQNIVYGVLADEYDEGYYLKLDIYADPLQVYIRRHARCEGYALLSQFMCTIAGIPTAYITGSAQDNGALHAWNAALTDGRWIFFDATWREWDMPPNYHSTSEQIAYYDGVFLIEIFPKVVSGYDVRMRLRTGFVCPDSVTVPDGVTWVELQNHPTLTGITLPDSVTNVHFAGCTGLTNVTLPAGIVQMNFSGCTDLKNVNIPNSVTAIGNSAFYRCTSLKSVTIPDGVTFIDHMAFADSGLQSVTIPGSVTSVGSGAFYRCADLKSVTIERGVGAIEDSAFMECTGLTDVTIPGSVSTIGEQAFYGCTALETVTISEGVTAIDDLAFYDCANLRRADLPDSLTSLGNGVFTGCPKLESLTVPASMTSIGIGAFQGRTDLESFVIPGHITEICDRAFSDCTNLKSVVIPESVKIIRYAAFRGCSSLESVTIPSSVTTIEHEVFAGCTGLTSLVIPEGVTTIGSMATPYTLESITLPTSVTSIGNYIFGGRMKDVYYAGTEAQWKAISIGDSYVERVTVHYNSAPTETPAAGKTGFADVPSGAYYEDAVKWAVARNITTGTSATTFSPDLTCTTAQILTFLWRAKGSPEPVSGNTFRDVSSGDYYYKAALWAKEKGLVSGNTLDGDTPCTRSATVTYLWKLAGSPAASGSNFTDVPSGADYAQAVAWAVEKGVTSGTGPATFSPDITCTRGQIVTFLHRDLAK